MTNDTPESTVVGRVSDADLAELKSAMNDIREQCTGMLSDRRSLAENTRFCWWDGQSDDGRKHAENLDKDPMPFEGASDVRDRLADQLTLEAVRLDVAAATRGIVAARPVEFNDAANAGKITGLLRWLTRNAWGADYRRQVELLSQYRHGDSPGVAIALVDWFEETCLQYREVSLDEVLAGLQELGYAPEDAFEAVMNPGRTEELAVFLVQLTGCKPAQARKAVRELREPPDADDAGMSPTARVAVPYTKPGLPRLKALRAYEDFFYPENTTDLQKVPVFYRRWLRKSELLAEAEAKEWNEQFVEDVLGAEEQSAFEDFDDVAIVSRNGSLSQPHKGEYEVIQAFYPATNDDGIPGIYTVTISGFSDVAATERELWDRKHGKMPFVLIPRETLTRRVNDSRGRPELVVSDQNWRKLVNDASSDNVQMTVLPPVLRPAGRAFYRTSLAPLGEMEVSPGREPKYMDPPKIPPLIKEVSAERRRQLDEYFGRANPEVDATLVSLQRQHDVDTFLAGLGECFALCVQLFQQYATDEQVARVVGGSGMQLARTLDEIQGRYDVLIEFDADDLDPEKAMEKTKMLLAELSGYDRNGILPVDQIIMHRVAMIFPSLADAMPTPEDSSARIAEDEKRNVVMLLNGIEPRMPEKLDGPQIRLGVFRSHMMLRIQNPAAFPEMTAAVRLLAQNRLKYLTQQVTQQQNAQIGRTGAAPVDLAAELPMLQPEPEMQPGGPVNVIPMAGGVP